MKRIFTKPCCADCKYCHCVFYDEEFGQDHFYYCDIQGMGVKPNDVCEDFKRK